MNKSVRLKSGYEEAQSLVVSTIFQLELLITEDSIAFYEAVMIARNPEQVCFGDRANRLKELAILTRDGRMHDSVRNIIVSAVSGEGLEMRLGNPVVEEQKGN
jgi:hypothetical protein